MVELPKDIKESIEKVAKALGTSTKILGREIRKVLDTDETISRIEGEESKLRYAWAIVRRNHSGRGMVDMYIQPFNKPRAREVTIKGTKKYVGEMCFKVKLITRDDNDNKIIGDTQLGAGTLWEVTAENAIKLSPKKAYRTRLKATPSKAPTSKYSWTGLVLSGDNATFMETGDDIKFPTNKEFYDESIKPIEELLKIEFSDLTENVGKNSVDIRVVFCEIINLNIGETNGNEYAKYSFQDDSMLTTVEDGVLSKVDSWLHPDDAIWRIGSEAILIGSVEKVKELPTWKTLFMLPGERANLLVETVKEQQKMAVDPNEIETSEDDLKDEI